MRLPLKAALQGAFLPILDKLPDLVRNYPWVGCRRSRSLASLLELLSCSDFNLPFHYVRKEHCITPSIREEDVHGHFIPLSADRMGKSVPTCEVNWSFDSSSKFD